MFLSVENIETLTSQKFISREAFARDYPVYPKRGDVLMTRIGDIGTSNVVETDDKLAFYVSLALLKPLNVDSYYLDKSLQSPSAKMELYRRTLHIAFPKKINKNQIAEVMLPIPRSRQEQEQIGALFRDLDTLITLHQRKRRKRLFTHLLVWEQRKFSDVAVIRRGLTYSPTNIVDGADGVRVLRSSNINEDHFVLNDDDVFVDEGAVNIDLVHDGDILITAANGSPRLVGKRARISDLPGKTVHGGFMLVASSPCSDFLCASMGSSWYRRFLATGVAGGNGAIGNLDSKALGETTIAVPNDAEIDKLGNFFTRLDSLITLHQ